ASYKVSYISGFFSVFGAGRASTVVEVTGVSGKDITITCSHDSAFDNVKYFCNSVCKRDKDVLIKSREWYSQEKYSIVDARNIFNVTIFHLTKQDAGTYWCGWEKFGLDIYQKVVLTVREGSTEEAKEDKPTTEEPKEDESTTGSPEQVPPSTSSSMTPLYIGASLGVITLAAALVLLIYFTQQKGKISTHPGKKKDAALNYAAVSKEKLKSSGAPQSSAAQNQDTVKYHDSLNPPDTLLYSTVSHINHMDRSQVSNQPKNVTYSTIVFTDESAVYCNKNKNWINQIIKGMAITLKVSIDIMTATMLLLTVTGGKSGSQAIGDTHWEDLEATVISKHVGESVQIQCPYPSNHDKDDQFVCKGDNPLSCKRKIQKTKLLRVNERKKIFSVYISDLDKEDSGTYWCIFKKNRNQSEYTKVQLHVGERNKSKKPIRPAVHVTIPPVMRPTPSMSSSSTTPSTHSMVKDIKLAVLVLLCSILSVVPVLILAVLRYKLIRKQGGSSAQATDCGPNIERDPADHLYEEIQMQSLPGHAMISSPTDLVHYSSVSFQHDSSNISMVHNSNLEPQENSSYSSVRDIHLSNIPVANTIYSTVTKPRGP
ncbi:uncharacterized protein LOC109527259, partial [Hippocampus comes]|uniref:uncharacterized protein LOC109527259 n=1 Tax=Hippocampus comes TaxID=109280 RepID=UPI00094F1DDF